MGVKKEMGMMMYSRHGGHGTGSQCLGRALDLVQARLMFLRFAVGNPASVGPVRYSV